MKILLLVIGAAALGTCASCHPDDVMLGPKDGCTEASMRCSGNVVEVCDGDQRWVASQDCDEVAALSGGDWVCDDQGDAEPFCRPAITDGGSDG